MPLSYEIAGAFTRLSVGAAQPRPSNHNQENQMKRVLYVGQDPETVDFSDPSLPPGFNADKIKAGIAIGKEKLEQRGWQAELCMIPPDAAGAEMLAAKLAELPYDCVVVGAGLRIPPKSLALFESVVNTVHRAAPGAAIAFNTRPEDTADAVGRWLSD
jgi:hypothetical protein